MRDVLRSSIAPVWVPVLGLAAGRASLDRGTDPGDLIYFVHRGEQLLSCGWANTFSDPMLQSGPLQLVVFGAVRNLAALALVLELAVAALLLYVRGKVQVADRIRLLVGILALAAGLTQGAFIDGHPAEAIVPLLWVLAGLSAREDRVVRAGALIGVSAGFELWGVLGAVLLLLAPRLKRVFVGGVVEAGVVVAMLAPFALAGSFRMFDHEWRVATGTILGLVVEPGTHFGWPLRLLQSALALAAGAAIARGHSPERACDLARTARPGDRPPRPRSTRLRLVLPRARGARARRRRTHAQGAADSISSSSLWLNRRSAAPGSCPASRSVLIPTIAPVTAG